MISYLRCCAGCAGSFAADNRPGAYYCPDCTAKSVAGFDPQPNTQVKMLLPASAPRDGYRPTYVVLGRENDTVTLRKLGFPDSPSFECSVNNLDPSYGGRP